MLSLIKIPSISILRRSESQQATGLVVVIDVLRAFTTAAYAFASGAEKIILISNIEEARDLAKQIPGSLLTGEREGLYIEGFDFDNSPLAFRDIDLSGRTLIQRTSSGTQGAILCKHCSTMLVSSFVVAEATLARISFLAPEHLTLFVTGTVDGSEDLALAKYFKDRFDGAYRGNMGPYLRKVVESPAGIHITRESLETGAPSDLDAALAVDVFPFSMQVFQEEGHLVVRPVKADGTLWH